LGWGGRGGGKGARRREGGAAEGTRRGRRCLWAAPDLGGILGFGYIGREG